MTRKAIVFCLLFFALPFKDFSQSLPSIQVDRPDQTESAFIVPKNHFQLESGFSMESIDKNRKAFLYPSMLWKYGVNDSFELRLITEVTSLQSEESTENGLNPVKAGFKVNITQEEKCIPLTSFLFHIMIPHLSSEEFRTTYLAPSLRFAMQHSLSEKISLGYNLGTEWDGQSAEPNFIYTLTTGFSVTKNTGVYIEVYGFIKQMEKSNHRCDGGLTYLVKQNIMIDISGGIGLTENAPDYYAALGFSFRLKN